LAKAPRTWASRCWARWRKASWRGARGALSFGQLGDGRGFALQLLGLGRQFGLGLLGQDLNLLAHALAHLGCAHHGGQIQHHDARLGQLAVGYRRRGRRRALFGRGFEQEPGADAARNDDDGGGDDQERVTRQGHGQAAS
jgi:hypothetical protein